MFRKRLFGLIAVFLAVFIVTMALGVSSTSAIVEQSQPQSQSQSQSQPVAPPPPPPAPPVVDPNWNPGDDRLNPDMAAPAALYINDGVFGVVDPLSGQSVLTVPTADLASCVAVTEVATAEDGKYTVTCYPGGFSLMVDKGDEMVIYLFDGVPPSTMITQTYKDGVLICEKTRTF